ncbi:MAG: glycogen synthase GlgA [Gammaproteobacteria bacterium]|nr:glycogen synthase GlgA [Gammaproteobacteria bacterium]
MNILFATSEVYPLVKTGGLADVSASLPRALLQLKQDIRIVLPAYQTVLEQAVAAKKVAECHHYGFDIDILQTLLPGTRVKVLMVDCPALFDRPGNPYLNAIGDEWQDNPLRFALFNQVVVDIALNRLVYDWSVDLVHCNDWQTGLTPALLSLFEHRPATLFSIHNLAYQGIYAKQAFFDLGLPEYLWSMHGLEFHDLFSFIKGGLNFADRISTVSPSYAEEIQTAEYGYGLEDLLHHRKADLSGILNGIDTEVWNPGTDKLITHQYNRRSLAKKSENKRALQQRLDLPVDAHIPVFGLISRLVEQKGIDLILAALAEIIKRPLQLVFLGSGQSHYEQQLMDWARIHPDKLAVFLGYDEALAHQIEAGSDFFLMPSLFEPCGLNQFYSLRYGTLPVVTAVGGLADSVIDYTGQSGAASGNGFVLAEKTSDALMTTMERALAVYHQPQIWQRLQLNAMAQDHSWKSSAKEYLQLYQMVLDQHPKVTV